MLRLAIEEIAKSRLMEATIPDAKPKRHFACSTTAVLGRMVHDDFQPARIASI
jgi:hypothetical protein